MHLFTSHMRSPLCFREPVNGRRMKIESGRTKVPFVSLDTIVAK
nr:MAG TPA: hypothetical protein [Caudoviricetes sp.]